MTATRKQIALIERLQEKGAPIPSTDGGDPDFSMMDSVQAADQYIKQNLHLLSPRRAFQGLRADEYGGIPNH